MKAIAERKKSPSGKEKEMDEEMTKEELEEYKRNDRFVVLELVRRKALELNDTKELNEWIIKEQEKLRNQVASDT